VSFLSLSLDYNIINNKIITTNNKRNKQNNIDNTIEYKIVYTINHNNNNKIKTTYYKQISNKNKATKQQ
jgi:hypothetical protein